MWGILTPLAIALSLLRGFFRSEGRWFTIHFLQNLASSLHTITAFAVAVSAAEKASTGEDPNHFTGHIHRTVGLIIFFWFDILPSDRWSPSSSSPRAACFRHFGRSSFWQHSSVIGTRLRESPNCSEQFGQSSRAAVGEHLPVEQFASCSDFQQPQIGTRTLGSWRTPGTITFHKTCDAFKDGLCSRRASALR